MAVVAVHGMGQQLPYETLDAVVQGLREPGAPDPIARRDSIGGEALSFVEMRVGGKTVDVYEAYWASLTEGRVTLRDVMSFLVTAATEGIANARRGTAWHKARGGGKAKPITALALVYASLVLASLVAMNAVIATLTARWLAGLAAGALGLASDAAVVFLAYLAVLALFGASLLAARRVAAMRSVAGAMLHVALVGTIAAALALGLVFLAHRGSAASVVGFTLPPLAIGATWLALAGASWIVRGVLVEYVGDVAAYVQSHRLDRFDDLRREIRQSVERVMRAVYEAKDEHGAPRYHGVAIVAHSLGSVVAYETLNALLLDGVDAGRSRTRLFLTFGSPLDKTAFLFAQSAGSSTEVRESLLDLKQPLLAGDANRPRAWVNVWSRADVISGALDYYGDVHNVEDPRAATPLLAHNEYWTGSLVWGTLRAELARDPPAAARVDVRREVRVRAPAEAARAGARRADPP